MLQSPFIKKELLVEYITFPDKLKGYYQLFTEAKLRKLRSVGYDKSFKTITEGITDYMQWFNCDN